MRKPSMWFLNRLDTKRAAQAQEMALELERRDVYYLCTAKTKALISFAVTAKLICAFVFASHMQNVGFLMTRLIFRF